MPHDAYQDKI